MLLTLGPGGHSEAERRDMEDREAMIEYLAGPPIGVGREEAERRMLDDDLWILHPEMRYVPEGEEVEQWKQALALAESFFGMVFNGPFNEAAVWMIDDLRARVSEALRRAEQRADERPVKH